MANILRKFWFVILVSVLFVGVIGIFIHDKASSVFVGKTADGKDVLFEVNKQNVFADDYFNDYTEKNGVTLYAQLLSNKIADESVSYTKAEIATFKTSAQSLVDYYVQNYASSGYTAAYFEQYAASNGFSSFADWYINQQKLQSMVKTYLTDHESDYFPAFLAAKSPRIVSHILISMGDPSNPTDAEKQRVKAVEDALASGQSFEQVALNLSEDTGTRADSGLLGYIDSDDSTYDSGFKAGALATADGQVSGWVQSAYGWHLIKVDSTSFDGLKDNEDFITAISKYYENDNLSGKTLLEKADTMTITFTDPTMLDKIKEQWGGTSN